MVTHLGGILKLWTAFARLLSLGDNAANKQGLRNEVRSVDRGYAFRKSMGS